MTLRGRCSHEPPRAPTWHDPAPPPHPPPQAALARASAAAGSPDESDLLFAAARLQTHSVDPTVVAEGIAALHRLKPRGYAPVAVLKALVRAHILARDPGVARDITELVTMVPEDEEAAALIALYREQVERFGPAGLALAGLAIGGVLLAVWLLLGRKGAAGSAGAASRGGASGGGGMQRPQLAAPRGGLSALARAVGLA